MHPNEAQNLEFGIPRGPVAPSPRLACAFLIPIPLCQVSTTTLACENQMESS
jgi:hypothetical protein